MSISLLSPIKVKDVLLRNRIVLPPMQTNLATKEGFVTEKLIKHYKKYAPWCGLIIVEHTYVLQNGRVSKQQLGIWSDKHIEGLRKLTEEIHKLNGVIAIQLNHAGARTRKSIINQQPVAPSPIPVEEEVPRELTKEEIKEIVKAFGEAARRAVEAGFDAIEVHGAHGFLLSQFISPLTNKRNDEYGGDIENRIRFPLEVVKEVKRHVKDIPLLYRIGATDLRPGGLTLEDSKFLAQKLVEEGVDILDVSGGLCGSQPPELQNMQGYFVPYAEEIKKTTGTLMIGGGGIKDLLFADKLIREGKIDLVYVGRAQLSDSEWAKRAVEKLRSASKPA